MPKEKISPRHAARDLLWSSSVATALSCYFFLSMDWVFLATKPSFLNALSWWQSLGVLFASAVPVLGPALVACGILWLLGQWLQKMPGASRAGALLPFLPAALFGGVTLFSLLNNFTYTVFRYSVHEKGWHNRILFTLLFVLFVSRSLRFFAAEYFLRNKTPGQEEKSPDGSSPSGSSWSDPHWSLVALLLLAMSVVALLASYHPVQGDLLPTGKSQVSTRANKNVLIFSSDGLSSSRMSVYGSKRNTTPYLKNHRADFLIFENHVTNSAKTTGSVGSLLTGKHPLATRVIYRPDIFRDADAYEHLPGLLKSYGYENGDFSVRHFIDAYDLNLRNSFDFANGRFLKEYASWPPIGFQNGYPFAQLFLEDVQERTVRRLWAILQEENEVSPFLLLTEPDPHHGTDRKTIASLKSFIQKARQPFFAHVHLLNTHGPFFPSPSRYFSARKRQNQEWMQDFYDDAILQFDGFVQEIFEFLKAEGLEKETLVILNSDHGFRWSYDEPIPLLLHFPGKEHVGTVRLASERLDIPPTILDYLGIPIPSWMEGRSLLSPQRQEHPIFIATAMPSVQGAGWGAPLAAQPPFFSLGGLSLQICDRLFQLDLRFATFTSGEFHHYTGDCEPSRVPSSREAYSMLLRKLADFGYTIDSLPSEMPQQPPSLLTP